MATASLGLGEDLRAYLLAHNPPEPDVLRRLDHAITNIEFDGWQTSPEQNAFMGLLARMLGVRRYLELGTFAGYGALSMALALGKGAQIVTCEFEASFPEIGRPFWKEAGVADQIDVRIGPAVDTMRAILADGQAGTFDMIFIDADKQTYGEYYDLSLELITSKGVILIDNVFWDGSVIDEADTRSSTKAIREINQRVRDDDRVDHAIVPIGDGLTIVTRKHSE